MRPTGRAVAHARAGLIAILMLAAVTAALLLTTRITRAVQDGADAAEASVRIVHGIADAGPLDVYIDGSLALIGIIFAETSSELDLAPGEHQFAVVASGGPPQEALASGSIALENDTPYYASLFGTTAAASVGLFAIDERPLSGSQARFRIINGAPDAGEIVPVFSGGEALSEPLAFGDAAQYAAIDAGAYDLDLLDAVSGAALLSLPQTSFGEGVTTDIFVVGLLADGSLQALVESLAVEIERPTGRSASIVAGTCADAGELVADLGIVQEGQGDAVGVLETPAVSQGFGLAAAPFGALISAPHAVTVNEPEAAGGGVIACGEIGGRLTDTGALVIALNHAGSTATAGVAVLAPGLEDPETTGVSVFLTTGEAPGSAAATPAAGVNG